MARLSPSAEDLLLVSKIQNDLENYFKVSWSKRWFVHGSSFTGYDNIHNKKIFFEDIKDEIDEQLNKKYGLAISSEMSISVDSIRRFILKSKKGFDDKVLEGFLILIEPSNTLKDYKFNILNTVSEDTDILSKIKYTNQYFKWAMPILAFLGIFLIYNFYNNREVQPSENLLTATIEDTPQFPKKAIISCDLRGQPYKRASIQFDNLKFEVTAKEEEFVHYLTSPKRAKIKLFLDDNLAQEIILLIPSNGWRGSINNVLPLSQESFVKNGEMGVSAAPTTSQYGDEYYSSFTNIKDFGIDGDLFSMEAEVLNNAGIGGIWAYDVSVDILGTKGDIKFNLLSPDASLFAALRVSETDFSHQKLSYHLSKLGVVLNDWSKLKVKTHKNVIQIILNDTVLVEENYDGKIGNVVGLQFYFKGAGRLRNVQMYPYEKPSEVIKL